MRESKLLYVLLLFILCSNASFAADYYWVSSSQNGGNWNNINNWRTSSGGTQIPSVVPGTTDRVIFDHNSYPYPTGGSGRRMGININVNVDVHSIIISGVMVEHTLYTTNNNTLTLRGSLIFQSNTIWPTNSVNRINTINFVNSNGVIDTKGTVLNSNINFTGSGMVILENELNINRLNISNGAGLDTNGYNLNTNGIAVGGTSVLPSSLNLGSSKVYVNGNSNFVVDASPNVNLDAGTSHIYLSVNSSNYGLVSNGHTFYDVTSLGSSASIKEGIFHNVTAVSSLALQGNNTIENLKVGINLSMDQTTQTIRNSLTMLGTGCSGNISNSITSGTLGTLSMPGTANVSLSNTRVTKIHATGGANFEVINGENGGGNTGDWVFTTPLPLPKRTLYWVGGAAGYNSTVTWADPSHWSLTSGGTSGECLPVAIDDVIFDDNSGITANANRISVQGISLHNLSFLGTNPMSSPFLYNSPSNSYTNVTLTGSLELQYGMRFGSDTTFTFRNDNEEVTIKSNGVSGFNILMKGSKKVSMLDDLSLSRSGYRGGRLVQNAGTFETNNYTLQIEGYYTEDDTAIGGWRVYRTLDLGRSIVYITGSGSNGINYSFNANHANGRLTLHAEEANLNFIGINQGLTCNTNMRFGKIDFQGKGGAISVNGNIYMKELLLPERELFSLHGTLYISKRLRLASACEGLAYLSGMNNGAVINMPATASVEMSNVQITKVTATGGNSFIVQNGIDGGNTTGWDFTTSTNGETGQTLYWVGGAGDWYDKLHWSNQSGGQGGYCVPGSMDNVVFDELSGLNTSEQISGENIFCKDFTVLGTSTRPFFAISSFNIYGSVSLQPNVRFRQISSYRPSHIVMANNNTSKTIQSNGAQLYANFTINETIEVHLLDDFTIIENNGDRFQTLQINSGSFFSNGHKVTAFNINVGNPVSQAIADFANSEVYATIRFLSYSNSTVITAPGSHIYTSMLNVYAGTLLRDVTITGGNNYLYGNNVMDRVYFPDGIGTTSTIYGNNQLKELHLGGGNYIFANGSTQTVSKFLNIGSDCSTMGLVKSATNGTTAYINMPSTAMVNVKGVRLQDIHALGGANFSANNSENLGNTTGWSFTPFTYGSLYWIGGNGNWDQQNHWSVRSGGTPATCLPNRYTNVVFDQNSGFLKENPRQVYTTNTSTSHDITFDNVANPIHLNVSQGLNVFGSITLQEGMIINGANNARIYLMDSREDKFIESTGVYIEANLLIYETQHIDILGDLMVLNIEQTGGTFRTNNYKLTINKTYNGMGAGQPRTLELGTSDVFIGNDFFGQSSLFNLFADQAQIYFNSVASSILFISGGQRLHKVYFMGAGIGRISHTGLAYFDEVVFENGDGTIEGSNHFGKLTFARGKDYSFQNVQKQTIGEWAMSGTPCNPTKIFANNSQVEVTGGITNFDFVNVSSLEAIGTTLHFGEKSDNLGNNINLTFDARNIGDFNGFGGNKLCHVIEENVADTYILKTDRFFGDETTAYAWYKIAGAGSNANTIISTASEIDIRNHSGYGSYRVVVQYKNKAGVVTCSPQSETIIRQGTEIPLLINSSFNKQPNKIFTLADVEIEGDNLKWYKTETGGTEFSLSKVISNDDVYYVTRNEINNCESKRLRVVIMIKNGTIYVNPEMRMRVQ